MIRLAALLTGALVGIVPGCLSGPGDEPAQAPSPGLLPLAWSNLTLPGDRGWFAVLLDMEAWCRAGSESLIEWRVEGEGTGTGSPWSLVSYAFLDSHNRSAHILGGAVVSGGVVRWVRVGGSAAGQPAGVATENPLSPDLSFLGVPDGSFVATGGGCLGSGAVRIEKETGHRPDAFLFTFAREPRQGVQWDVRLRLPAEGARFGSGGVQDHVVFYEEQVPWTLGASAGPAVGYAARLDATLGAHDAVTTLVFLPGNEAGAGPWHFVRTNASMTPPGGATQWVEGNEWAAFGGDYGQGDWSFTIEAKARPQHNEPVVAGVSVPRAALRPLP